jgi:hypothetical protein
MIPKQNEVIELAKRQWHSDRAKMNDPAFDINPELGELSEGGYLASAKSSLMHNLETQHSEWLSTSKDAETSAFKVDIQQLFESNALILGSRHTGKSDLAMMISDKANAIVIVFDPSLDWIARSSIKQYVKVEPYAVLDVPSESVIYDVSLCSPQDQQKIVENFAKNLFEHQAQAENRRQYLVIFEESHTYFYQGCMRARNMRNTVRLLSVGRNVDIAVILVSQFASMLDKFAIKHSTSQAWFGFTREPNDIKYLKQILGSEVEKLSKLNDGEFLYLTRNGISKIQIQPYESMIQKQEIASSEPQPLPTMEVRPRTPDPTIAIARLLLIAIFCALMLKVYI